MGLWGLAWQAWRRPAPATCARSWRARVHCKSALALVAAAALLSSTFGVLPWAMSLSAAGPAAGDDGNGARGRGAAPDAPPCSPPSSRPGSRRVSSTASLRCCRCSPPTWPTASGSRARASPAAPSATCASPTTWPRCCCGRRSRWCRWSRRGRSDARRMRRAAALALMALTVFGITLSGSRTGLVGIAVLALWGGLDRRLSRTSRGLLLAAPLLCAAAWGLTAWWAAVQHTHAIGAAARLGGGDFSASRFAIWRDTLSLIARPALARRRLRRIQLRLDVDAAAATARWRSSTTRTTCRCNSRSSWAAAGGAGARAVGVGAVAGLAPLPRRRRPDGRCAARRVRHGAADGAAQPTRVPALVRVFPAADRVRVGLVPGRAAARRRRRALRGRHRAGRSAPALAMFVATAVAAGRLPPRGRDLLAAGRRAHHWKIASPPASAAGSSPTMPTMPPPPPPSSRPTRCPRSQRAPHITCSTRG